MKEFLDKLYVAIKHPVAPLVTFIIGLFLGLLLCSPAQAGGRHYHEPVNNVTNVTRINQSNDGIANAIAAAQHQFDFGTHSWQGSIGVGSYASETSVSFGVAKRLNRALVNASFSMDSEHNGVGLGVNWRF